MNTILSALKSAAAKHGEAIVIAAALVIGGRSYLQEHDARLAADAAVKTAQAQIADLAKQQAAAAHTASVKVTALQDAAAKVKTAPEATAALQSDAAVKAALPSLTADPALPDKIEVEPVELFKAANQAEQTAANLTACNQELGLQKQIDVQKDSQITALKKKPSFWTRMKRAAIDIGCAGAAGAVGASLKSPTAGMIGSMGVTAVCRLF